VLIGPVCELEGQESERGAYQTRRRGRSGTKNGYQQATARADEKGWKRRARAKPLARWTVVCLGSGKRIEIRNGPCPGIECGDGGGDVYIREEEEGR
jgi:hypothetical protein